MLIYRIRSVKYRLGCTFVLPFSGSSDDRLSVLAVTSFCSSLSCKKIKEICSLWLFLSLTQSSLISPLQQPLLQMLWASFWSAHWTARLSPDKWRRIWGQTSKVFKRITVLSRMLHKDGKTKWVRGFGLAGYLKVWSWFVFYHRAADTVHSSSSFTK